MHRFPLILLASSFLLTACTAQVAYQSSQDWQRNECYKITGPSEREHCLEKIRPTYEEYRRTLDKDPSLSH